MLSFNIVYLKYYTFLIELPSILKKRKNETKVIWINLNALPRYEITEKDFIYQLIIEQSVFKRINDFGKHLEKN